MNSKKLKKAGFFAMISAVLGIPLMLLSYHFSESKELLHSTLLAVMQLAALCLYTYIYSCLKKYLNHRFSFYETDSYIDFLITINIVVTLVVLTGHFLPGFKEPVEMFSLLLIISFGTAQLFFGIKLFLFAVHHQGMLKPFCYLSIVTGILIATIVLLPIASLTGAITDVMLGTIFFQASEVREEPDAG